MPTFPVPEWDDLDGGRVPHATMTARLTDPLNETAPAKAVAKGDVFVATGANTIVRIAVGDDQDVLQADSGEASGVKWSAWPAHTHDIDLEDSDEGETTDGGGVDIGKAVLASTTDNTDVTSNPSVSTRLCGTCVCATGGAVGAGDKFALIIDGVEVDSVVGAGANALAVLRGSGIVASGARVVRGQLVTDATAAQRQWFCGVTAIGVSIGALV